MYYQSFQEALREATGDYQSQKQAFDSGFFASPTPEVHKDFEKVWRERTMEPGWGELSAPTATEESVHYPKRERMKSDYTQATKKRYVSDTSQIRRRTR